MKSLLLTLWNNKFHTLCCMFALLALMSANKTEKITVTPYQILIWEIKANEGYRPWWYRDGYNRGRMAYSIGYGWNDLGNRRRHEIKKYTNDGKVSQAEALQITIMELKKYGTLNKDPYKNLAMQLYSYNCGLIKNGNQLGKCCGARWGCGSPNKDVRKQHNRRRKFEMALWNRNNGAINEYCNENKTKLQIINSRNAR